MDSTVYRSYATEDKNAISSQMRRPKIKCWKQMVTKFATLETKSNVGRVASRSRLWDRYWGQNGSQLDNPSPVTIPQATMRCDSPQIASRQFLKWQIIIQRHRSAMHAKTLDKNWSKLKEWSLLMQTLFYIIFSLTH